MWKPVYAICKKQTQLRLRIYAVWSASLLFAAHIVWMISNCYTQNFKTITLFCNWTGRFESSLPGRTTPRTGYLMTWFICFYPHSHLTVLIEESEDSGDIRRINHVVVVRIGLREQRLRLLGSSDSEIHPVADKLGRSNDAVVWVSKERNKVTGHVYF